jgi:hypothetical protein
LSPSIAKKQQQQQKDYLRFSSDWVILYTLVTRQELSGSVMVVCVEHNSYHHIINAWRLFKIIISQCLLGIIWINSWRGSFFLVSTPFHMLEKTILQIFLKQASHIIFTFYEIYGMCGCVGMCVHVNECVNLKTSGVMT